MQPCSLAASRLLPPSLAFPILHSPKAATTVTVHAHVDFARVDCLLRADTTGRDVTEAAAYRQDQEVNFSQAPRHSQSLFYCLRQDAVKETRDWGLECCTNSSMQISSNNSHPELPAAQLTLAAFLRRQVQGEVRTWLAVPSVRHSPLSDWLGDDPGWDKPLRGASRGLCDGVAPSTVRANVDETGGNAADSCRRRALCLPERMVCL